MISTYSLSPWTTASCQMRVTFFTDTWTRLLHEQNILEFNGFWCSDTGWPPPVARSSPKQLPLSLCLPAVCSLQVNKGNQLHTSHSFKQSCLITSIFTYLLPRKRASQEWCEHQSEGRRKKESSKMGCRLKNMSCFHTLNLLGRQRSSLTLMERPMSVAMLQWGMVGVNSMSTVLSPSLTCKPSTQV